MAGAVGPGWSWMRIYSPWRDDSPLGYGDEVFDTQQAASADLERMLPRDLEGEHADVAGLLRLLRSNSNRGPLVLYYVSDHGLIWAWPIYPVASGEDPRQAGAKFFAEWRTPILDDQDRFLSVAMTRGASVFPRSGFGNAKRDGDGSGGGCAVAALALPGVGGALLAVSWLIDLWV